MILDANGNEIKQTNVVNFYSDFRRWSDNVPLATPEAAWEYQQNIIDRHSQTIEALTQSCKKATDHIEQLKQTLTELKKFTEENMVIMSNLEIENMQLKDKINEQGDPSSKRA